ncbi:uncharacterized protein H6S33_010373 [Morchella sextelata]|uniref:uncharacterized protein n=1 Tax=Morchella sextelata TaxID=1174677 RepID=UPI001D04619F|nr:uncharacterized protein H6S33_010373 [Morchella sextelata]KAH0612321.1 hypothetical protein H6S33_010373 [Morchella sextelata]
MDHVHSQGALIIATHEYVKAYMAQYDSSHDYQHILRVLSLAQQILAAETSTSTGAQRYNPTIVTLLALLHDVGDKKYSGDEQERTGAFGPAEEFLLTAGCDPALATTIQKLINNVSYSHERANPEVVAEMCRAHPELEVVQDADRLDAIGAVGVGRAFTFGAAKRPGEGMGGVIDHFEDKLLKLEAGMKTAEGKRLAKVRAERIRVFREWWVEETEGVKEVMIV